MTRPTQAPPLDIDRARRETDGCETVTHFNNAGSALPPRIVVDGMIDYLREEARYGGYETTERQHDRLTHTYTALAQLINANPHEIAVIENATRAWDMAFYAIPFKAGDRILTARAEYGSNYIAYLQVARRTGAVIEAIPCDDSGQIDVAALRNMMDERVRLISITHIPTNGGLINPAAEIGQIARQHNVLYLLDACQTVGQMPVDVSEIGCDMLSATGRKFLRGPRGTGFLYVREGVIAQLEPPMLDLHAATWTARDQYEIRPDARRFENWETNYAGKLGLGIAADYALSWGMDAIWARIQALAQHLRAALSAIPNVTVRDLGQHQCGIVTFTTQGHTAQAIKDAMAAHHINITVTTTLGTRLDMEARNLTAMNRASIHYYNTDAEIDRFATVLEEYVKG